METNFTYNQALFGLLLLGAKADGKLQDEEKRLLVDLTSEDHHISAEEYKYVITEAKRLSDQDLGEVVYDTLNTFSHYEKIQAGYWLDRLLTSDKSTNNSDNAQYNVREMAIFQQTLTALGITEQEINEFAQTKKY